MAYDTVKDSAQRSNIQTFYDSVEMPGGWHFDTVETLKLIELYSNSQFATGNRDSKGMRKFFFQIIKDKVDIARKFIDLDTKDIIFMPEDGNEEVVWLMERDFKRWIKDTNFAQFLNYVGFHYPHYGHVFAKRDKDGKWNVVQITNVRFDPSSPGFDTDNFFYEVHRMSLLDIEAMGWDTTELKTRPELSVYDVYECYDRTSRGWNRTFKVDLYAKVENGGIVRAPEGAINDENTYAGAITVHADTVSKKDFPYRELKWESVPGRRLGRGIAEILFDAQVRANEVANLKAKGLYFTSLHLYQTRDDKVGGNVITSAENGDILKLESELTPVANEERNLAAFQAEEVRWDNLADKLTFSFDIARGENLPSRTPLGVANLSAGMVASYFELKRENFGIFIKNLILDDILPRFQKWSAKEHILTIQSSDAEIEHYDNAIAARMLNKRVTELVLKSGMLPNAEEIEAERQRILTEMKSNRNRYRKITEGFYDNAKYVLDVNITGEQVDTGVKSQSLNTVLQVVGSNPMILQNKATRSILFEMLSLAGISPVKLNLIAEQAEQSPMQMMQGGSISVPNATPGMGQVETQV